MSTFLSGRVAPWLIAFGFALLSAAALPAQSSAPFTVLHSFAAYDSNYTSLDGSPGGFLREGPDGNFYACAANGGVNNSGTLFRITPAGDYTVLREFGAAGSYDGGVGPNYELFLDADGSFYGTTGDGGANGAGTIFQVTTAGQFTSLYSFGASGRDSADPLGSLVRGDDGNFYGVTESGGTTYSGSIFKFTPDGAVTSLYSSFGSGYAAFPPRSLIKGSNGNFYGTTQGSSTANEGDTTIFCFTPAGQYTTLHTFNQQTDGIWSSELVQAADGSLYGESPGGGANGNGTIFRITTAGEFSVVFTYPPGDSAHPSLAGRAPVGGLIVGRDNNFYGVTYYGGTYDRGTIFRLTPSGAYSVLYNFGDQDPSSAQSDGRWPSGKLCQGSDGNLYGTTIIGGANGTGVIFKLALSSHPAFFDGEAALNGGAYYLSFLNGNPFGYYSYLTDARYIYHFDLGYEYVFDAADGHSGVYLYDFKSQGFFYTSPTFPFPYLYDFTMNTVLYYYPDPSNPGHYNTNGYRFFYRFDNGQIIVK